MATSVLCVAEYPVFIILYAEAMAHQLMAIRYE